MRSIKDAWSKGVCLHPQAPGLCFGKPIDSHTIQKARVLESIAEEGHVLTFKIDVASMLKSAMDGTAFFDDPMLAHILAMVAGGATEPRSLGWRQASVFPGFCKPHDHDTFAPIEEEPLTFDDRQCFLLAYRAACMEVWEKGAALKLKLSASPTLGIEQDDEGSTTYNELGLEEHARTKAEFDSRLMTGNFRDIRALVFNLDVNPGVATSGFFAPEISFQDEALQNLADVETPLQHVAFCLLPGTADCSYAFFGWLDGSPAVERFAASILELDERERPDALLRLAFESFENTFMSPSWWDALNEEQQMWVRLRSSTGGFEVRPLTYKPDGNHLAKFKAEVLRNDIGS